MPSSRRVPGEAAGRGAGEAAPRVVPGTATAGRDPGLPVTAVRAAGAAAAAGEAAAVVVGEAVAVGAAAEAEADGFAPAGLPAGLPETLPNGCNLWLRVIVETIRAKHFSRARRGTGRGCSERVAGEGFPGAPVHINSIYVGTVRFQNLLPEVVSNGKYSCVSRYYVKNSH